MRSHNDALQQIINNIDIQMKKNGMTAKEFAQKIGKRTGIVTDWRTGRSSPSIETLIDICNLFNCNLYDIFPSDFFTKNDAEPSMDLIANEFHIQKELSSASYRQLQRLLAYYLAMSKDDQDELIMIAKIKHDKEKKEPTVKSSLSENKNLA